MNNFLYDHESSDGDLVRSVNFEAPLLLFPGLPVMCVLCIGNGVSTAKTSLEIFHNLSILSQRAGFPYALEVTCNAEGKMSSILARVLDLL